MRALLVALAACGKPAPAAPAIPAQTTQLVTAVIDGWDSSHAQIRLWSRDVSGWKAVGDPWPAVIGKAGAAWGRGLHGDGAPAGRGGPIKREGDGKSPAGAFALRGSYGYAAAPPPGDKLPYTQTDASWQCVDDAKSAQYTRIVDRSRVAVDWTSAEAMHRDDELYTWVVDVAHNPKQAPGGGSCIFLHVWRGPDSSTVGCTAMAEPQLSHLISVLEPTAVFVLLPRGDYAALATAWGLPAQ